MQPLPALSDKDIRRFWSHVDVRGPDECWPWKGCTSDGYGRITLSGASFIVHRVAYFLHYGVDPGELLACHTCDNRPCCNWAHLFRGTRGDNNTDRANKGRSAFGYRNGAYTHPERRPTGDRHGSRTSPESVLRGDRNPSHLHPERLRRGERHYCAKLTATQVAEIRRRYAAGGVSQRALAKEFGIAQGSIGPILRNKTWRAEPLPEEKIFVDKNAAPAAKFESGKNAAKAQYQ